MSYPGLYSTMQKYNYPNYHLLLEPKKQTQLQSGNGNSKPRGFGISPIAATNERMKALSI
jgi:hypothetical protein